MVEFKAEIKNLDKLVENFRRSPEMVGRILQKAVSEATLEVFKTARRGVVPWATGTLARTFNFRIEALKGRVFPTRAYAIFVHEGSRPHDIVATKKKALWWEGAAHPVKRVHHPGYRGNRFLPRMLEMSKKAVDNRFELAGKKIAEGLAG
jgi:hypothetical protein